MPEGNTGNIGPPARTPGNPFGAAPTQRPLLTRNKGFRSRLPNSHNNGNIQLTSSTPIQPPANKPNPFSTLVAPITNNTVIEPTEEELAAATAAGINPFDTEKLHDFVRKYRMEKEQKNNNIPTTNPFTSNNKPRNNTFNNAEVAEAKRALESMGKNPFNSKLQAQYIRNTRKGVSTPNAMPTTNPWTTKKNNRVNKSAFSNSNIAEARTALESQGKNPFNTKLQTQYIQNTRKAKPAPNVVPNKNPWTKNNPSGAKVNPFSTKNTKSKKSWNPFTTNKTQKAQNVNPFGANKTQKAQNVNPWAKQAVSSNGNPWKTGGPGIPKNVNPWAKQGVSSNGNPWKTGGPGIPKNVNPWATQVTPNGPSNKANANTQTNNIFTSLNTLKVNSKNKTANKSLKKHIRRVLAAYEFLKEETNKLEKYVGMDESSRTAAAAAGGAWTNLTA